MFTKVTMFIVLLSSLGLSGCEFTRVYDYEELGGYHDIKPMNQ